MFYVTLLGLGRLKFGILQVRDSGTCSAVLEDYTNDPRVRNRGVYSGDGWLPTVFGGVGWLPTVFLMGYEVRSCNNNFKTYEFRSCNIVKTYYFLKGAYLYRFRWWAVSNFFQTHAFGKFRFVPEWWVSSVRCARWLCSLLCLVCPRYELFADNLVVVRGPPGMVILWWRGGQPVGGVCAKSLVFSLARLLWFVLGTKTIRE
jgi:hypothetical protein